MKLRTLAIASLITTSLLVIQTGQAATSPVNWGYSQHGAEPVVLPESWGEHYPYCNGKSQSPIDITNTVKSILSELDIEYENTPLDILNNGHTIEVEYEPGSSLFVGDEDERVLQFHFHTPSENIVDGKSYPMEMHIVHTNTASKSTVVAVFIEEGAANATFAKIINNAPKHEGEYISSQLINVKDLLPKHTGKYFNYSGSLTTPPCTEGVNWIVMENTITFSAEQIKAFEDIMVVNSRPLQETNGRTIHANVQ